MRATRRLPASAFDERAGYAEPVTPGTKTATLGAWRRGEEETCSFYRPNTWRAEAWSASGGPRDSARGGGRVFDLEQPRTAEMPIHPAHQQAGYSYTLHRHHEDEYDPAQAGPRTGAAGVIICGEHTGTHIDALCHQADDLTLYGGIRVDGSVQSSRGFRRLAAEDIPSILAPGVLLDVAANKGVDTLEPGYVVTDEDLEACCEEQGVAVEPGSVALARTGNARFWDEPERYLSGPGMETSATRWLADRVVLAGRTTWRGMCRGCATRSWAASCRGT